MSKLVFYGSIVMLLHVVVFVCTFVKFCNIWPEVVSLLPSVVEQWLLQLSFPVGNSVGEQPNAQHNARKSLMGNCWMLLMQLTDQLLMTRKATNQDNSV